MVNNLDKFIEFIKLDNPDNYYYLEILVRNKDNPRFIDCTKGYKTIKHYIIRNKEELLNYYPEICAICDLFKARLYGWVNKRSLSLYSNYLFQICQDIKYSPMYDILGEVEIYCNRNQNCSVEKNIVLDVDNLGEVETILHDLDSFILYNSKSVSGYNIVTKELPNNYFIKYQ